MMEGMDVLLLLSHQLCRGRLDIFHIKVMPVVNSVPVLARFFSYCRQKRRLEKDRQVQTIHDFVSIDFHSANLAKKDSIVVLIYFLQHPNGLS